MKACSELPSGISNTKNAARADLPSGPIVHIRWRAEEGWPIEFVSENIAQFGWNAHDLIANSTRYADLVHPDDANHEIGQRFHSPDNRDTFSLIDQEYRLLCPEGKTRWVYDYSVPVKDEQGLTVGFDGYILDITARKREQRWLTEARATLDSIRDGVITTNIDRCITYLNPIAEHLTDWPIEDAKGQSLETVLRVHDETTGELIKPDQMITRRDGSESEETRYVLLHRPDGKVFDITYSMAPIENHEDERIGHVIVFHDATNTRTLERELKYQASHDSLTDLPNRREFERRLDDAILSAERNASHHVLIYIDLDQFKIVNDTCGHRAGDELLKRVSAVLRTYIRQSDILARLGGDEFGILLHRCSIDQATVIADKLRLAARAIHFMWENKIFDVGLSIGIVEITADSGSRSTLMSAADMACYAAKDLGRNRIHVYEKSNAELNRRRLEMQWLARMHQAFEDDRFVLFSQAMRPVSRDDDGPERNEILVRMYAENGNLVPAQAFLSAAERYNLITELDRWVIRECFGELHTNTNQGQSIYSINVSGASLSQADFLDYIKDQLREFQVSGSQICFEITETAAISNPENAYIFVSELKSLGCYFALDDFGIGLSSFGYLKELSVDYLKIDGSFIQNIVQDPVDRALVAAINDVGHVMLIDTVAECVENQYILKEIREIGIDYAQGSYIGKPKPLLNQKAKLDRIRTRIPEQDKSDEVAATQTRSIRSQAS
ncbi:MAG: EAL domain-containing protein [Gammaproteobacteria bacterium]|nr:EAL domain-containing protein [Gammaproteobacteria bacterium]